MNKVTISGILSKEYTQTSSVYEGILTYQRSTVRLGNVFVSRRDVGVYYPKELSYKYEDLLGKVVILEGSLVSSELDRKTRTTMVVITSISIVDTDPEVNLVEIDGDLLGIATTKYGVNYSIKNSSDCLVTRVFSKDTQLDNKFSKGDHLLVHGHLRSYTYRSKQSGTPYNVTGVLESKVEKLESQK